MKKIALLLLLILTLSTCKKDTGVCDCDNPLEDLLWLKELKESITNCTCKVSIIQASYKKQTVFFRIMNDPLCDGQQVIALRDCNGDIITYMSPLDNGFNEVTNPTIIYSCK